MAGREPRKTAYLYDTPVENIFIGEYLPELPGDFVKVYLYALMNVGQSSCTSDEEEAAVAKALHMSPEDVRRAFLGLTEYGLMEMREGQHCFLSMKERLYGKSGSRRTDGQEAKASGQPGYTRLLDNREVADMTTNIQNITGRFLLPEEQEAILSWIGDLAIEPDLVTKGYEYAKQKGVDSYRYVEKVVLGWAEAGIKSRAEAEDHLEERDERHFIYQRIMKSLGNFRHVTEKEAEIIDAWIDDLGCTMDEILAACDRTAGTNNPNLRYVDAVIRNRRGLPKEGGEQALSRTQVLRYYQQMREAEQARVAKAKEEVYGAVPQIRQLDENIARTHREMAEILVSSKEDRHARAQEMRDRIDDLEKEKARLLTERDIPVDYMETRYHCNICKDTGLLDSGSLCSCYMKVAQEAAEQGHEEAE